MEMGDVDRESDAFCVSQSVRWYILAFHTNGHNPIKSTRSRNPILTHPLHSRQVILHPRSLKLRITSWHPRAQTVVIFRAPARYLVISIYINIFMTPWSTGDIQHPRRVIGRTTNDILLLHDQHSGPSLGGEGCAGHAGHAAAAD